MKRNPVLDDLKHSFSNGGMTVKLIFVNVAVFILISLLEVLGSLVSNIFYPIREYIFILCTSLGEFIYRPWGLFTYMFAHFDFFHMAMNLLFLYSIGSIFEQYFSGKRMLYTYILGGVFGGLLEILVHFIFPSFSGSYVVGASGSVMAIMAAISFYKPNLKISVFGFFEVKLLYITLFFIFTNLYAIGTRSGQPVAYFAHLGGILLGYLYARNPFSANNLVVQFSSFGDAIVERFKPKKKRSGNFTYTNPSAKNERSQSFKTDEQYNAEAKNRQESIDKILDKISKGGYESLTKEEKDLLFKQSNRR